MALIALYLGEVNRQTDRQTDRRHPQTSQPVTTSDSGGHSKPGTCRLQSEHNSLNSQ